MIKTLFIIAWLTLCAAFTTWTVLAIWFQSHLSQTFRLGIMIAVACIFFAYAATWFLYRQNTYAMWSANIIFVGMCAIVLAWWGTMKPSLNRDWAADVEHTVTADVQGGTITFRNVRDFTWNADNSFVSNWKSETYDLNELNSVDVLLSYWTHPAIAHTLISFGFSDGRHLVFSAEIRKKQGQEFSSVGGFFRSFELAMIAAEESDIVYLRTNVRKERVYRYAIDVERDLMQAMLLQYVEKANDLAKNPAFYNTMTSNCTTVVFDLVRLLEPQFPFDYRVLLSGYLPELLYDNDLLENTELPFSEIHRKALLSPVGAVERDRFSGAIRLPAGAM